LKTYLTKYFFRNVKKFRLLFKNFTYLKTFYLSSTAKLEIILINAAFIVYTYVVIINVFDMCKTTKVSKTLNVTFSESSILKTTAKFFTIYKSLIYGYKLIFRNLLK